MIEIAFQEGERYKEIVRKLTQWDYGQQIRITGIPISGDVEVHFAQSGDCRAFRVAADVEEDRLSAEIPNKFLEEARSIYAYVYVTTPESGRTEYTICMTVKTRARPEDYEAPADKDIIAQLREEVKKKADGAQINKNNLQLTSEGEPVGDPVTLPSGAGGEVESIPNDEIDEMMKGENENGEVSG